MSRIIENKAYSIKTEDSILIKFLPSAFMIVFLISVIVGGSYLYISRREVRHSLIENVLVSLNEAKEYQKDCLETLNLSSEIINNSIHEISSIYQDKQDTIKDEELKKSLEDFLILGTKVLLSFENRKNLHEREIKGINTKIVHLESKDN